MSDTPRTDSVRSVVDGGLIALCDEYSHLARQLERELNEALAWKKSALAVEREMDEQSIAKMLGGKLGDSCRQVIQKRVPEILSELNEAKARIAELERLVGNTFMEERP